MSQLTKNMAFRNSICLNWQVIKYLRGYGYYRSDCSSTEQAPQKGGKYKVDAFGHLNSKVDALFSYFDKMSVEAITLVASIYNIFEVIGHVGTEF